MAVERMETCDDVGELARELGVRPRCLYRWRRKLEMVEPGQEASRPSTHASAHRKEIHRLGSRELSAFLLDHGASRKLSAHPLDELPEKLACARWIWALQIWGC